MRALFTGCLILAGLPLVAQSAPPFQAVDSALWEADKKTFCTPGILHKSRSHGIDIAYDFNHGGVVRPNQAGPGGFPGELESLEALIIKIKAPLINGPGFKLIVGFNYEPEKFLFSEIPVGPVSAQSIAGPSISEVFQRIDSRRLKHTSLNLYAVKPLNDHQYLGFRFRAAYNGAYSGLIRFDNRYASYQGSIGYGVKKSDDFEMGFGLNFSTNMQRTLVLPFFLYNRNFSRKWGLEAIFPASVKGRYNINPSNILLFGYEFSSRTYSVDVENTFTASPSYYHFSHAEVRVGAGLERQIVPWVWLDLKAGLQFNLPANFRSWTPNVPSYTASSRPSPYFTFGFFLSPPDKFYR